MKSSWRRRKRRWRWSRRSTRSTDGALRSFAMRRMPPVATERSSPSGWWSAAGSRSGISSASARPPLQIEIGRIELGQTLQPVPIVDRHLAVPEGDERLVAKLLQHPVDMDGGEAGRVGEVGLRQRQGIAAVVDEPDDAHAYV